MNNYRFYKKDQCISFRKTKEAYGGLSNMASGFPLVINNIFIFSSEALYQCCRFPHLVDVQHQILNQVSPMSSKMVSKPYRNNSRLDWEQYKIRIMKWCLKVKLCQNWDSFSKILLSTGDLPIVEDSYKDTFWGAIFNGKEYEGINALGRLLMELREEIKIKSKEDFLTVKPLTIDNFLLFGQKINIVTENDKNNFLKKNNIFIQKKLL